MKLEDVRAFARSLPETTEQPHFEMSSFRVRGKIYATVPPDEEHLHVFVDEDATRAAVAHPSGACEELWWGKKLVGVRVDLGVAEADLVFDLVEESWKRKAPKSLVEGRS
jgi:hypothetical protein